MKEIRLGTAEDMVETLIEYLRKKWQWAEQWLGTHYIVTGFLFGFGAYTLTVHPEVMSHERFAYYGIPLLIIYIASAWHWFRTRKPELLRDEHGRYTFTYKPIHGKRAVFNVKQRAKDIISNSKIPVITLIKGNKVRVEQDGQQSTRTAKKFGMTGKNGKPVYNWTLTQKFALNEGSYDFKNDVNWHLESERVRVRQQLQGFRKQLSISLGIPDFEIGTDYTFQNGFFVWKTIAWRDTSIPQEEKDRVIETETYLRKKRAGAYVKASLANPDIPDYRDSDWYE